ncbi:MAG: hypothetical protein WCR42_15820 [bacterium]
MVIATPNLKAQSQTNRIDSDPSDCIGFCTIDDAPWTYETIPVTVIDENGNPCSFTMKFVWRYCAGQLYIQNQEVYGPEFPEHCFQPLRATTHFIEEVYTSALEYLVANNKVLPTATAKCYIPAQCVKWCCYDDAFAQVGRAFLIKCTENPLYDACCTISVAYNSQNQQAYRVNLYPYSLCNQSPAWNICPLTLVYHDGVNSPRTLTLVPIESNCEVQCVGF